MPDQRTITHIDSSSGSETYEIVLVVKTKHVHSSCTCKAGIFGNFFKHKTAALNSLGEAVHDTGTWNLIQQRDALDKEIAALQSKKKSIAAKLKPTCHRPGEI